MSEIIDSNWCPTCGAPCMRDTTREDALQVKLDRANKIISDYNQWFAVNAGFLLDHGLARFRITDAPDL